MPLRGVMVHKEGELKTLPYTVDLIKNQMIKKKVFGHLILLN